MWNNSLKTDAILGDVCFPLPISLLHFCLVGLVSRKIETCPLGSLKTKSNEVNTS